jgi:hypothetical protein
MLKYAQICSNMFKYAQIAQICSNILDSSLSGGRGGQAGSRGGRAGAQTTLITFNNPYSLTNLVIVMLSSLFVGGARCGAFAGYAT